MTSDTQDRQDAVSHRLVVIEAAIAVFRKMDYALADLAAVADEAGLPLSEVEQHFPDWDSLLVATVDRWNGDRMWGLQDVAAASGAVAFCRATVQGNVADPALVRVLMVTFGAGASPTHPARGYYRQQYALYSGFIRQTLERDIAEGREPATTDAAHGAAQLLAMVEGLSIQSLLLDIDLVEEFDRAASRLRRGWTVPYAAHGRSDDGVWEL